jgi:CRP-like cAMP-binding protein
MSEIPSKAELKKNLRALQERLQQRPMDLDARMRVARTYRLLGRADDAVAHYAAVARYLSLAGHPLQAIAVLQELLQLDPKHEDTLRFLAKLYARTRATETANRGRVAVPILDPADTLLTLGEGAPPTDTGMWRAAATASPADFAPITPAADSVSGTEQIDDDEKETAIDRKRPDMTEADAVPDASFGEDYEVLGQMTTGDLLLPQVPLFSSLTPGAFVHLSQAMTFSKVKAGTVIFQEGQAGDSCIVISRGSARVTRKDIELAQLHEGDIAGIFALMAAQTRQASLTAICDLEYFKIDRFAIDELVQRHPPVKVTLARFFRERLLLSVLASLPFFQTLESRERQALVKRFKDRDYEPGDELFFEGAENDGLWVILEGRIQVMKEVDGKAKKILQLAPGDYVGSLARVNTAQADLSALATTVTKAAVLSHQAFSELLDKHKDIASARECFVRAGMMAGDHVFAGNGTLTGQLVGIVVE